MKSRKRLPTTVLTAGVQLATSGWILPFRRATWRLEPWAMRTWTITASGRKSRLTVGCGARRELRPDGLLISLVTGFGARHGAGRGSMMRPGATLPSTMAAGYMRVDIGDGGPDRLMFGRSMLPHWWRSSVDRDGPSASDLEAAADTAGAR